MRRLPWATSLMLLVIGCGGGQPPTTPTSISSPAPQGTPLAPPPRQPLHVVGRVVDGASNPVTGAKLTQWDTANTAISDASGAFEVNFTIREGDRSFWLTVEKSGYETSELNRSVDGATATVLRLRQIQSIASGGSLRSVIDAADSACGYHWGYVCRRVRVMPQSSGTLTLQVVSDTAAVLGIPVGSVGFPQSFEQRISLPAKAGTEVVVEVAADWQIVAPAEFALNTSLTPAN